MGMIIFHLPKSVLKIMSGQVTGPLSIWKVLEIRSEPDSELIISAMQRNTLRVIPVLAILTLAVLTPLISSGYSELKKASASTTYSEAAAHYWNAAQRIPWRADLYELSGHASYYAAQYSRAEAAYQRAFQRNALSPDGWVAWGDVIYLNNEPQRAAQIWEQALAHDDPSENLYSRLSQVYKQNGDYGRAAQYLQRYVSLHPQDASAHYRLGLLLTLTDPDRALSELISASQLDPQLDPAVQALRSALNLASLENAPSARLVLTGRGLGLVQEWELARLAFESAIAADEMNAEAWAWLGESKQQSAQDGSVELEQALKLDPNSSTVRGLRGLYFQRTGNHRSALIEFQAAAALDDQNPAWQVSIGETYSKLGDLIRALDAYQSATKLAPGDANYWRLLALFCAQNNVNIESVGVPAAQKAVVLASDDAAALDLLGWLLQLDARYAESERMLLRALATDPQNASAHFHLGLLYLQTEERVLAREHFVTARDLGSPEAEAILAQYFP
jgi:tetratricopeptide (TPR) repeat protein